MKKRAHRLRGTPCSISRRGKTEMGTRTESGAPAIRPGGARIIGDLHSDHSGPGPDVMAAQTLQGNAVVNALGEDLGHIEQIMLDVRRGQIAYAVLSFGAALGMGEKLFA